MPRGRVQIEWHCANQTRADTQRDWLILQLSGRGYLAEEMPRTQLKRGEWVTTANIGFNTVAEGNTVTTLCTSRQAADPFILSGSWTQVHTCPHEDGSNTCASTLIRTVK